MKKQSSFESLSSSTTSNSSASSNKKLSRFFSFTASRDWFYRYYFNYSGLRSVSTDISDGTTMHCWIPKSHNPSKPDLVLVHGFGANAMWQYGELLRKFVPRFNVYVPDLLFFGGSYTDLPYRTEEFQVDRAWLESLRTNHFKWNLTIINTINSIKKNLFLKSIVSLFILFLTF